jgi:hypothetical protein
MANLPATDEPPGDIPTPQVEPETVTEGAAEEAAAPASAAPPVLHGLAAALAFGGAVCLAGALIAFHDHSEATAQRRPVVHPPRKHTAPAPQATPVLAQVRGIVVGYDGESGTIVIRSGGMRLVMGTGASTTFQSACVAPARLHPGQQIVADVQGHSNGALTVLTIAPASGAACRNAPAAPGMPRIPPPASMRPGTGTLPPPPDGSGGADAAAPPHP